MDMKIKNVSIKSIREYGNNAKIHPDEQVKRIANSIKEFGFRQPIVVDGNGTIIIGHGRYRAAKFLGLDSVPVIEEKNLSEEQVNALRLADNKTNESEWDHMLVAAEIAETEIDMSEFGFDVVEDEGPKKQKLDDGGEITLDSFTDDKFQYECPCCGFRFIR